MTGTQLHAQEFGSLDDLDLPEPEYTTVQARADATRHAAIRDAYEDGRTVPCVADPASWDAARPNITRAEVVRVAVLCRTECPVLAECAAFLATDPPVTGVHAGRYVRHHTDPLRPGVSMKADWARAAADDAAEDVAA
jgi:hypothetical protein